MSKTLLIGLGNPGEEYAATYHNVGWEALDFFAKKLEPRHGAAAFQAGKHFRYRAYGDVVLIYPDTYMNESGRAVEAALAWFHATPADAVVFHDDSDLAVGEYRDGDGGAAGHHGVESIQRVLPDAPIRRMRIGIRDPREKSGERPRRKAGDFVLKKISAADLATLETDVFEKLAERFLGDG